MFKKSAKNRSYKTVVEGVRRRLEEQRRRERLTNLILSLSPTVCALGWTAGLVLSAILPPGSEDFIMMFFPITMVFAILSSLVVYRTMSRTSKLSLELLLKFGSLLQGVSLSKKDYVTITRAFERLGKDRRLEDMAWVIIAFLVFTNPLTLYACAFIFPLMANQRLKANSELEAECFAVIRKYATSASDAIADYTRTRKKISHFRSSRIAATAILSLGVLSGYWQFRITKVLEALS